MFVDPDLYTDAAVDGTRQRKNTSKETNTTGEGDATDAEPKKEKKKFAASVVQKNEKVYKESKVTKGFIICANGITLYYTYITKLAQEFCTISYRKFENSAFIHLLLELLVSEAFQFTILKFLQINFNIENFLFILSTAAFCSFLLTVCSVILYLPCPTLAALVSNASIIVTLLAILYFGLRATNNIFQVLQTVYFLWPWLPLLSIIARLFIDRDKSKNPFSPLYHFPAIGIMGAGGSVCMVYALKKMTLTDGLIALCLDPLWGAFCSAFVFLNRREISQSFVRFYVILIFAILLYYTGELIFPFYGDFLYSERFTNVCIFSGGRILLHARSIFLKRSIMIKENVSMVPPPDESFKKIFDEDMEVQPRRFIFSEKKFSEPILFRLNMIWDSGLVEDVMHGTGKLGTVDYYTQTDSCYLVLLVGFLGQQWEARNVIYGFFPPSAGFLGGTPTYLVQQDYTWLKQTITNADILLVCILISILCIGHVLRPWIIGRRLFSVGSSAFYIKYYPSILSLPFLLGDWLFLNPFVNNLQIVMAIVCHGLILYYRDSLWEIHWRRHLVRCTSYLNYMQPSVMRILQKETLYNTLKNGHTEEYGQLLLNTCIAHGNNMIDDPSRRDDTVRVWDPHPVVRAAWKLTKSFAVRHNRHVREVKQARIKAKADTLHFVKAVIKGCIDDAVDSVQTRKAVEFRAYEEEQERIARENREEQIRMLQLEEDREGDDEKEELMEFFLKDIMVDRKKPKNDDTQKSLLSGFDSRKTTARMTTTARAKQSEGESERSSGVQQENNQNNRSRTNSMLSASKSQKSSRS